VGEGPGINYVFVGSNILCCNILCCRRIFKG